MTDKEKTLWGIHGGKTGDADHLFLKTGFIALGWAKIGDLAKIPPTREAFKQHVGQSYPERKAGAIPVDAGQLLRFSHEMQIGDLVAYPSKFDREIHIGEVTGNYVYDPSHEQGYPHLRSIKWLKSFPRTHFTQGALYEIGSAMSFFLIKNYAEEYIAALEGKAKQLVPVSKDETVALVAADIEDTTRDFILKQLSQVLKGHPLAHFVAHLLETMGYSTKTSPPGADGGVDIVAQKDELGLSPNVKVQVKAGDGTVSLEKVQALYGSVETNEFGLFVTLSTFSKPAHDFASRKPNLRLVDGNKLVDLTLQYYERFNPHYQTMLPLKRVYVPNVQVEAEE